jgi:Mn2+/Fe2+ NRAMP family transporter
MSDPLSQTGRDVAPPLEPPQTWSGIFSQLGPGLIIAAAIVGSGELIATTLTGARAGITLLWLIILGCVVKVFAQIEIGRFTISTGTPTLSALAQVPGPRIRGRGNWLVWYWFVMWFCSIGQLGGIVGGVGQVMALVRPITQQGADFQKLGVMETEIKLAAALDPSAGHAADATSSESIATKREQYQQARNEYIARYGRNETTPGDSTAPSPLPRPWDDRWWAVPVAVVTSWMLIYGGYSLIQSAATAMVAVFTLVTVFTVVGMQWMPEWSIPMADWWKGLSFGLPEGDRGRAIATALATVGIIGVGAAELIQYPYWCLEKGYARFTGPNDGSDAWLQRARGWLRVMHYDVWVSMVIYTTATLGFFALGVGILHRSGLVPEGSQLIQTLSVMYEPVLGSWAPPIFLLGAFMVLYSTFFVANASHARTFTDGLSVTGFLSRDPAIQQRSIHFLSGLFPMLCLLVYWILPEPAWLVLISGSAQAIMLPMLGFAALYFRYAKSLPELRSGGWFDVGLWVSVLLLLGIGVSSFLSEFRKFFGI